MKLLIAEDDEDSRVYLERALTAEGYQVKTAINGADALAAAREEQPELIVSDIMMPQMDGFELCRNLKADDELKNIPFIFYTATYLDSDSRELGLSLGASRYLEKPMELPAFLVNLSEVLKEHELGKFPIHEAPLKGDDEIKGMYQNTLSRKLEKKVRELEQANQALRESEVKYRRLVENLSEEYFFYSHGTDGVFTYLSPSITNVLGYSPEEYLKHYEGFYTDNPINKIANESTERSIRGERQPTYEVEVNHMDGSKRCLEVNETPIFNKEGEVTAVEGIAHDITEKLKAEVELEKHREHLEELVEERTMDLNKKTEELTAFNVTMIDREMRIIELKEEVNRLATMMGNELPYPKVWKI